MEPQASWEEVIQHFRQHVVEWKERSPRFMAQQAFSLPQKEKASMEWILVEEELRSIENLLQSRGGVADAPLRKLIDRNAKNDSMQLGSFNQNFCKPTNAQHANHAKPVPPFNLMFASSAAPLLESASYHQTIPTSVSTSKLNYSSSIDRKKRVLLQSDKCIQTQKSHLPSSKTKLNRLTTDDAQRRHSTWLLWAMEHWVQYLKHRQDGQRLVKKALLFRTNHLQEAGMLQWCAHMDRYRRKRKWQQGLAGIFRTYFTRNVWRAWRQLTQALELKKTHLLARAVDRCIHIWNHWKALHLSYQQIKAIQEERFQQQLKRSIQQWRTTHRALRTCRHILQKGGNHRMVVFVQRWKLHTTDALQKNRTQRKLESLLRKNSIKFSFYLWRCQMHQSLQFKLALSWYGMGIVRRAFLVWKHFRVIKLISNQKNLAAHAYYGYMLLLKTFLEWKEFIQVIHHQTLVAHHQVCFNHKKKGIMALKRLHAQRMNKCRLAILRPCLAVIRKWRRRQKEASRYTNLARHIQYHQRSLLVQKKWHHWRLAFQSSQHFRRSGCHNLFRCKKQVFIRWRNYGSTLFRLRCTSHEVKLLCLGRRKRLAITNLQDECWRQKIHRENKVKAHESYVGLIPKRYWKKWKRVHLHLCLKQHQRTIAHCFFTQMLLTKMWTAWLTFSELSVQHERELLDEAMAWNKQRREQKALDQLRDGISIRKKHRLTSLYIQHQRKTKSLQKTLLQWSSETQRKKQLDSIQGRMVIYFLNVLQRRSLSRWKGWVLLRNRQQKATEDLFERHWSTIAWKVLVFWARWITKRKSAHKVGCQLVLVRKAHFEKRIMQSWKKAFELRVACRERRKQSEKRILQGMLLDCFTEWKRKAERKRSRESWIVAIQTKKTATLLKFMLKKWWSHQSYAQRLLLQTIQLTKRCLHGKTIQSFNAWKRVYYVRTQRRLHCKTLLQILCLHWKQTMWKRWMFYVNEYKRMEKKWEQMIALDEIATTARHFKQWMFWMQWHKRWVIKKIAIGLQIQSIRKGTVWKKLRAYLAKRRRKECHTLQGLQHYLKWTKTKFFSTWKDYLFAIHANTIVRSFLLRQSIKTWRKQVYQRIHKREAWVLAEGHNIQCNMRRSLHQWIHWWHSRRIFAARLLFLDKRHQTFILDKYFAHWFRYRTWQAKEREQQNRALNYCERRLLIKGVKGWTHYRMIQQRWRVIQPIFMRFHTKEILQRWFRLCTLRRDMQRRECILRLNCMGKPFLAAWQKVYRRRQSVRRLLTRHLAWHVSKYWMVWKSATLKWFCFRSKCRFRAQHLLRHQCMRAWQGWIHGGKQVRQFQAKRQKCMVLLHFEAWRLETIYSELAGLMEIKRKHRIVQKSFESLHGYALSQAMLYKKKLEAQRHRTQSVWQQVFQEWKRVVSQNLEVCRFCIERSLRLKQSFFTRWYVWIRVRLDRHPLVIQTNPCDEETKCYPTRRRSAYIQSVWLHRCMRRERQQQLNILLAWNRYQKKKSQQMRIVRRFLRQHSYGVELPLLYRFRWIRSNVCRLLFQHWIEYVRLGRYQKQLNVRCLHWWYVNTTKKHWQAWQRYRDQRNRLHALDSIALTHWYHRILNRHFQPWKAVVEENKELVQESFKKWKLLAIFATCLRQEAQPYHSRD